MTGSLIRPAYGEGSLVDLLPSVLARLGVPGELDVVGLPPAAGYCVLLVDGLGWTQLRTHPGAAPFLTSLPGRSLTTPVPSTTATSITSLGTGLPPGRHGLVGYQSRIPGTTSLLNALDWDSSIDPADYQPYPDVFTRGTREGIATTVVSKRRFTTSGLTRVALSGGTYRGADTVGERVAAVDAAFAQAEGRPALVYAYDSDLDSTGHRHGPRSAEWYAQLRATDALAQQLVDVLPSDVALLVTGDHGMCRSMRRTRSTSRQRQASPTMWCSSVVRHASGTSTPGTGRQTTLPPDGPSGWGIARSSVPATRRAPKDGSGPWTSASSPGSETWWRPRSTPTCCCSPACGRESRACAGTTGRSPRRRCWCHASPRPRRTLVAELVFFTGTMDSGKSTLALQMDYNHSRRGLQGLLLTRNDRAGAGRLSSRLGLEVDAVEVGDDSDLWRLVVDRLSAGERLDYVIADEAQFLSVQQVNDLARLVDDLGVHVFAFGILTDFRARLFPGSARLVELADDIRTLQVQALCWCGAAATHNARTVDGVMVVEGDQVVVGDVDASADVAYEVLCRKHHRQRLTAAAAKAAELSPQVLPFA